MLKSNIPSEDKFDLAGEFDQVLGLSLEQQIEATQLPEMIQQLKADFDKLRKEKNYAASDVVRGQIVAGGYEVQVTENGSLIKKR